MENECRSGGFRILCLKYFQENKLFIAAFIEFENLASPIDPQMSLSYYSTQTF